MTKNYSVTKNKEPRIPSRLNLHKKNGLLEIVYGDHERYVLACEYLRVYSPSADVRGHGNQTGQLATGKRDVGITDIKRIGHYAIQLIFSDGHETGLYTWPYLYDLCDNQATYWQQYLDRLAAAGASREADIQILNLR